jgi:hypothetical protein
MGGPLEKARGAILREVGARDGDSVTAPSTVIGRSYAGRRMLLGLAEPLELLGGDCLGPDGIAADLCLEWVPGLATHVAEACRRQVAADRNWLKLPPTALIVPEDDYALHLAAAFARAAKVPFAHIDLSKAGLSSSGMTPERGSHPVLPPMPVLVMATSGCANPVIVVTGADTASDDDCVQLAGMLDARTGRHWACEALEGVLDLGCITWLIVTRNEHALHRAIYSRVKLIPAEIPRSRALRTLSVAMGVIDAMEIDAADVAPDLAPMIDEASWHAMAAQPLASIREQLLRQFERAAMQHDG